MALLLTPRIWTSQPQGYVPVSDPAWKCVINPAVADLRSLSYPPIAYTSSGTVRGGIPGRVRNNNSTSSVTNLITPVSVPGGSDFTAVMVLSPVSALTYNGGFFRSATGGDTFCVIKTGTWGNLPFVRLNTVTVLNASSGPAVPNGRLVTVVFTVRSGKSVQVAWDGAIQHNATFSTTTPAFTFTTVGHQGNEPAGDYALFSFATQAFDAASLSANPWQIFAPQQRRIFIPAATGGGTSTSLVIADATHGHAADNLTLSATGSTSLVVADASHAHTAESPGLSTQLLLAVADAAHAQAADNLTLTVSGSTDLTVADAAHAHAADAPTLSTDWLLSVADAAHAHAADNVALSLIPELVIADSLHGHVADGPSLTLSTWLAVADATHAHRADNVALTLPGATPTWARLRSTLARRARLTPGARRAAALTTEIAHV